MLYITRRIHSTLAFSEKIGFLDYYSRLLIGVASLACIICLTSHTQAVTYSWINTSGGAFSTNSNWSPMGIPAANDTASFTLNNSYSVVFSADAMLQSISLSQGQVSMLLGGKTLQLTSTNSGIGGSNGGSLNITNGTFLPNALYIGISAGSNGTLSLLSSSATTVSGAFYVGNSGTGNLNVLNGATLTTSSAAYLGRFVDGVGQATINGGGSNWTVANTLNIGSAGNGSASVLNGGTLTVNALNVGEQLGSIGKLGVSGASAVFTCSGTANIGGASAANPATAATLDIDAGATMNLNGTTNLRTTSTINITGGTLHLNTLNITSGATVNWSAGKVQFVDGSAITASLLDTFLGGTHTLGTNRTLAATNGTLNLDSNLAINGGTLNVSSLNVNAGLSIGTFGTVTASDIITLASGKTLQIDNFGTLGATNFIQNNGGTILANGANALVTGFVSNDAGVVQGSGHFAGGLNNGTTGTIRALPGDQIIIDGIGLTNLGKIELSGGTVEYSKTLTNSGIISGRGEFRGGTTMPQGSNGLSNSGILEFSAGTMDIHGGVINSGTGKIIASGGSVVTFYDALKHNGAEIKASAFSSIVCFGLVSGAGSFTGSGTIYMEGGYSPGNSPAIVDIGTKLVLGDSNILTLEIGGTNPGNGYDQLDFGTSGFMDANGLLVLSLINGFIPQVGQVYEVWKFDPGQIIGNFDQIIVTGSLMPGTWLDTSDLFQAGTITVVPEPSSLFLIMASFTFLLSGMLQGRFARCRIGE